MFKIIAIAVLLATAAYCSYQITAIVNWQNLLRKKQESFGVKLESHNPRLLEAMKQIRMISATCAALVFMIPGNMLPFYQPPLNESYLAMDSKDIDQNSENAKQSYHLETTDKTTQSLTTTASVTITSKTNLLKNNDIDSPKQSLSITSNYSLLSESLEKHWNVIQSNLSAIEEMVIESYEDAPESLTQARVKSLLNKNLKRVDMNFEMENHVIKIRMQDEWFRLLLKQVDGSFYVYDEVNNIVYVLD